MEHCHAAVAQYNLQLQALRTAEQACPKLLTFVWRRLDYTLVLVAMTRRLAAATPACEIRAHASDTVKGGVDHIRKVADNAESKR